MLKPNDQLSATARGYRAASRVLSACMEMVVPCLVGYWLDAKFGTSPWWALVGLALGLWLGIKSLIRLAANQPVGVNGSVSSESGIDGKDKPSGDGKR